MKGLMYSEPINLYGSSIEITRDILNESNYDFIFERMKEEWKNASLTQKVYILGMYKLPNRFKKWLGFGRLKTAPDL